MPNIYHSDLKVASSYLSQWPKGCKLFYITVIQRLQALIYHSDLKVASSRAKIVVSFASFFLETNANNNWIKVLKFISQKYELAR